MSQQLNKEDNLNLWMWILGISDDLSKGKITNNFYDDLSNKIQKEVIRLNIPSDMKKRGGSQSSNKKPNSIFFEKS